MDPERRVCHIYYNICVQVDSEPVDHAGVTGCIQTQLESQVDWYQVGTDHLEDYRYFGPQFSTGLGLIINSKKFVEFSKIKVAMLHSKLPSPPNKRVVRCKVLVNFHF